MGRAASQCDSLMTGFTQHGWLPLQRALRERGEATREKGSRQPPKAWAPRWARCGSRPRLSTGGMCGHPDPAHWPPVSPSLLRTQAFLLPEWTDLVPTCPLHLLLLHLEPAPRPRPSSPPGSSSSLSSSSHAPRHRLPEPPGFSSRPVSCCRFNLIVELPGSDGVLCTRLFPHRGSVSRGHRPRSAAV